MDTNDKKYFDAAFKLIQTRLTNLETQVTMLFNAEKKRYADAQGVSFEQVDADLKPMTISVHQDLTAMADALKAHIESEA